MRVVLENGSARWFPDNQPVRTICPVQGLTECVATKLMPGWDLVEVGLEKNHHRKIYAVTTDATFHNHGGKWRATSLTTIPTVGVVFDLDQNVPLEAKLIGIRGGQVNLVKPILPTEPNFAERCKAEATRDVVFILRRKVLVLRNPPNGYEVETDGDSYHLMPKGCGDHESLPTNLRHLSTCHDEADQPCAAVETVDEGIWLSRQEAESYAKSKEYNYPDGWQVYGIPANGKLAELLKGT